MRLLLDTHAFLWWIAGDAALSTSARAAITDEGNEIFVSAASVWEMATKHRIGKLPGLGPIATDLEAVIAGQGFQALSITLRHGQVAGALPGPTVPFTYDLEYGSDTIEIQTDAIQQGQRVIVLDDLLATGGTMEAAIQLCRKVGGDVVGAACIIELSFLGGRAKLDVPFNSVVAYDS